MERRDFLKLAASLSVGFSLTGLPKSVQSAIAALDDVPRIIYLQGLSCTGCSVSLLQTLNPSPVTMITRYSNLVFHSDLSAASGASAAGLIADFLSGKNGAYFLALEGAIPMEMPDACVLGEHTLHDLLQQALSTMSGAIAVGSCASNGGIPAAEGNPVGAASLSHYMDTYKSRKLLMELPGCPIHPDWLWHTVVHLVRAGVPELAGKSPAAFYGKNLHELCNRYHHYQEKIFAEKLGEEGCLFKLGCNGPNTDADCPTRWWNNGTTWCVNSNSPCVGCASKEFARRKDFPFYRINELNRTGTAGGQGQP